MKVVSTMKMSLFVLLISISIQLLVPSESFVTVSVLKRHCHVPVGLSGPQSDVDVDVDVDVDTLRQGRTKASSLAMASSNYKAPKTSYEASYTTTTERSKTMPKYPVQRGEELDSRKIVSSGRQHLTAIRLNHILFATEELATQTLYGLKTAALAFDELAMQISNCAITRDEKGSIGWVNVNVNANANNTSTHVKLDYDDDDDNGNHIVTNDTDPITSSQNGDHHLDLILPPDARKKIMHMNTKVSALC